MSTPAIVLVTGAAGSVGGELVPLLLAAGYRVRAALRPGTELPGAAHPNLEIRAGDMTEPDYVRSLVPGVAAVVHTAARIDITLTRPQLEPINLDAVRNLYDAARAAGVRDFVFLSTASIYRPSDAPHGEEGAIAAKNPYEECKIEAEQYLREQQGGPRVVVVRPSMIYGPRNRDLAAILPALPPLCQHFLRFGIGLRGGPSTNWVHAKDVARAIVFLLAKDAGTVGHGSVWNVADATPKPFGAVLDDVYAAYGFSPAVRIPLYSWMRPFLGWFFANATVLRVLNRLIGGGWARLTQRFGIGATLRPKVFPDIALFATRNWIFSPERLFALGFRCEYPDGGAGWADAISWYRAHGWLPRERGQ